MPPNEGFLEPARELGSPFPHRLSILHTDRYLRTLQLAVFAAPMAPNACQSVALCEQIRTCGNRGALGLSPKKCVREVCQLDLAVTFTPSNMASASETPPTMLGGPRGHGWSIFVSVNRGDWVLPIERELQCQNSPIRVAV